MAQDRPSFVDLSAQLTTPSVQLPPEPDEALAALAAALEVGQDGSEARYAALANVVRRWPAFVGGWAALAGVARGLGRDVEAYAFGRTGYHRALDRLRGNGWRGTGLVVWAHEPNRSALLAFYELFRAAERIGETPEVERLRKLLLDSDPSDPLGVGG
ncbi:MAG: DUF3151 domain-containing protein [Chloroflexi bacterium]|nr:DUF3151 domain-containing protein [Chloroflexota bacterium]